MIHLAVALFILVTDCEPSPFYYVRGELGIVCMAQEIMDAREVKYIFKSRDEFSTDVMLMRKRHAELYAAPMLWEAQRFVATRDMANELLLGNRRYKNQLVELRVLYPGDTMISQAIEETEFLYRVWDAFRDARCEYYYVHVRRAALKKLREMLSEDMWRRGSLPDVVRY